MTKFTFTREWDGNVYSYCSENEMLHVRSPLGFVDSFHLPAKEAARLLMDMLYGTMKPITSYHGYGRDGLGSCPRCGNREI